jgi:predicted ABC-type transport system involved in lysophospholipase L1 biosynthesis ATPase subunit
MQSFVVQAVVLPTDSVEIDLREVSKSYERAGERLVILDKLSMQVPKGQFVALMGPSGSGKSTLLNLIAGLDRPSSGTITCSGRRIDSMTDGQQAQWRASAVGFVFQSYNLIPVLTAAENVELPLLLSRLPRAERSKRAETALRVVGLAKRGKHYPASSRAARNSGSRSLEPSSTTLSSSSPMSRPAISIARQPTTSSSCWGVSTRSSGRRS